MLEDVDEFITMSVVLILLGVLVLIIAMLYLTCCCPNNTALYLSVLVGLSLVTAIIASTVTIVTVCKNDGAPVCSPGFLAWWVLAILSLSFTIASAAVLPTEELENNPYLIWNWGEQS